MTRLLVICLVLFLPEMIFSQERKVDTVRVFYLGGQSNMDGFGFNKDLPDDLNKELNDVWIFHGNPAPDDSEKGGKGLWKKMSPGHGIGFSSNDPINKLSERFGAELSFARKMQSLYPDEKIAIIKYSLGGTSIDTAATSAGTWDVDYLGKNGINQYDHFLNTVRNAFSKKDIDNDGTEDFLVPSGIVWMQGESDAQREDVAMRYYENLKKLMGLIRATFRSSDLPVVIGKISDSGQSRSGKVWAFGELVQYGQEKFVRLDDHAAIVRQTKHYKHSDAAHYNSEAYIDLGERFAQAIFDMNAPEVRLLSKATKGKISITHKPSDKYRAKGARSLIDQKPGSKYFDDESWLGFEETDLAATIDLGSSQRLENISIGLLQDVGVWIFFPEYVEISWSEDGKSFNKPQRMEHGVSQREFGQLMKRLRLEKKIQARYIKVYAKNVGKCPDWHVGAGEKAWLFVDEITVK
ncbi:sialate O-acetylesterase [Roseivirga sp. E12]|uniref:sialate O-acetylesterase n=1 Tax=Roseivirga sp. E12 TaxID=2819237 RepID=UPI001ABC50F5|nr:sialate O-acetylesterase [Roseivirga sp. E12]MBO3699920.1 discoidin domain-containing protein [Roseivirga sp. E12]